MRAIAFLLLVVAPALAEKVTFKTSDGLTIVGTFVEAGKDAPTVVCLPMYGSTRASYDPLVGPLVRKGLNVLAIDLRGHGESAPELATKVKERDEAVFAAMYLDVAAALDFLEKEKKCDRTRVALIGASVGCSVAIDYTRRHPGDVRAVVLLTPGSKYLGLDSLAHLKQWPGTSSFLFTSSEERKTSEEVMKALGRYHGGSHMVIPGEGIHGTRMFGKVNQIEDLIANYLDSALTKSADVRAGPVMKLRRADQWVLVASDAITISSGRATVSIDGKKTALKAGDRLPWDPFKAGTKLVVELRPEKGPKLRFPSKGQYAVMPRLND